MIWAPFPHWKTIRSFALNMLRDEGMGKKVMEPRILDEVERYSEYFIEPHLGEPISLSTLNMATCNIVSGFVFGKRSDYDDPDFNAMLTALNKAVKANMRAAITQNIPLARFLRLSGIQQVDESSSVIRPMVDGWVNQVRASLNLESPQHIFDYFFQHQKLKEDDDHVAAFRGGFILQLVCLLIHPLHFL